MRTDSVDMLGQQRAAARGDEFRPLSVELKRVLRSGWWLILLGLAGGFAYGAIKLQTSTPSYRSSTQFYVSGTKILDAPNTGIGRLATQRLDAQLSTPLGVLKSDTVLEDAVRIGNLAELPTFRDIADPVYHLLGNLKLVQEDARGTAVQWVMYDGPIPQDSEAILQAVVDAYERFYHRWQSEGETAVLEALSQQRKRIEDDYRRFQKQRRAFQVKHGQSALGDRDLELRIQELSGTAAALTSLELRRIEAEVRLAYLQAPPVSKSNQPLELDSTLDFDNGAATVVDGTLRTMLRTEQQRLESLERNIGPDHPEYRRARARITGLIEEASGAARAEIRRIDEQRARLEEKIQAQRETILDSNEELVELRLIDDEIHRIESLLSAVDEHIRAIEFLDDYGAVEVVMIRAPRTDPTPLSPDPTRAVTVPTVIGLLLGLALAYWFAPDEKPRSIGTIDSVERWLGVPVLGVVPEPTTTESRLTSAKRGGRFRMRRKQTVH